MGIRSYRDLDAWKTAMRLAEGCYKFTEGFPNREVFGLAAHIRRSAVSIPSNIAEGHSRRTRQAYANHLTIAMGSQAELETQVELAVRLGFGSSADAKQLLEDAAEVGRILNGLWSALRDRDRPATSTSA